MPGKTDLSKLNCSLARTLEVVGDWWTLLIIRDAFLGVRRFGDFQKSLGIAKNILATRLERLAANDILQRGGPEKRPVYQLTERGQALLPAMIALMQWGDAWLSAERPPVLVTDAKGKPVSPLHLRSGGEEVRAETVRFHPGPGSTARTRAFFAELSRSGDASGASGSATIRSASRRRPRQGR